jgi:transposase-like protein
MFIGVTPRMFDLHLKERQYRFNNRNKDFHQKLLKLLEVKL